MLLKNLTKIYISKPERVNNHGEYETKWIFIKEAYLNLQEDVNELDRKPSGEINYGILKARIDRDYNIENGFGISLKNVKKEKKIIPEYRVLDHSIIGNSYLYRLEQYHGS
ncbi:MAG: hypothetical protein ACI4ON_00415 [Clostridia bacterium]